MLSLIIKVLIGAGIGAAVGHFRKCSSGTCPLAATWRRGAIYGGMLGLLFSMLSVGSDAAMNESTKDVKRITQDQFEVEVSQSTLPVVVDFYATWCGPCKILAPRLDKLASSFTNQIKFIKINVDEAPDLSQRYQIEGIPTLKFFKSGKVVDSITGLLSSDELATRLQSLALISAGSINR